MTENTPGKGAPASLPDWGVPLRPAQRLRPIPPMALAAGVGVVLWFLADPIIAVGAALALLIFAALILAAIPGGVLRRERAVRARPSDAPRLHNLVGGLCRDLGIQPPELWVSPGPPNAVALHLTKPMVCVRRDLLETFTRTELEATLAFLLTGIVTSAARAATAPGWAVSGKPFDPAALDLYSVSVTRYPPALAAALSKCSPFDAAGLWLAGGGDDVERRAAALLDL